MTEPDPAVIAAKLTGEQRANLLHGSACGSASQMVKLGLWKPEFNFPSEYYVTTPLGLAVRDHLKGTP